MFPLIIQSGISRGLSNPIGISFQMSQDSSQSSQLTRLRASISPLHLTATLEHAPPNVGKQNVSEDIKSSNPSELAGVYASVLLIPTLAKGGKTATATPRNRIHTFKQQLLVRDDYRCVTTGYYYYTSRRITMRRFCRPTSITRRKVSSR